MYSIYSRPTLLLCYIASARVANKTHTSTSVFGNGRLSTHADPTSTLHTPRDFTNGVCEGTDVYVRCRCALAVRFWASGGTKYPKMGDSLHRITMNHRAKFDAASFILTGEIRNRTNKQTHKKQRETFIHTLPIGICG